MTFPERSGLATLVEGCRRAIRRRAGGGALLAAAGTFILVLPAAWLLAGPRGWTPGSPVPLLLLFAAAVGAGWVARRGWTRIDRWTREDVLATQMERSAELPDGSVRAQIELARGARPGASATLASAGERAILERLPRTSESLARDGYRDSARFLRTGALLCMAVGVVALGLWTAAPDRSRTAWAGLASPVGTLFPDALPPLEVHPGDADVRRGEEVSVSIEAPGRREVTLHWESPGVLPGTLVLTVEDGVAGGRLPAIEDPVDYWVRAPDGARSPTFGLRPLDPLVFSDLSVEIRFPGHTGLLIEHHSAMPTSLSLPVGSSLRFSGSLMGMGSVLRLRGADGGVVLELPVEDEEFQGEWRPRTTGAYRWDVAGETEAGSRFPAPLEIDLIPDEPPAVQVHTEADVREFPASLRLPLTVLATDDWGLDWIELEVTSEELSGRRGDPVRTRTPAEDRREVALGPVLDVSDWGLEPGSLVRVRARAADRAPVPGVTESSEIVLRLPDAGALREGARDRVERAAGEVAELAERARRSEEAMQERARDGESRSGSTRAGERFESREEFRTSLEEQSALTREVQELREELARARESLAAENQDLELRDRMAEMERLLDEVAGDDAREYIEELLEQLNRGDDRAGEDSRTGEPDADRLAEWQEQLRDRLEEAVERFRRAALESAFEGAEEEAGALADAQDAVMEQMQEGAEGAVEAQEATEQQAARLEERLAELQERLREAGDFEVADRAQDATESVERSREAMREAADAARSGAAEEAAESAEEASQEARQAMEELEAARMEWLEEWEEGVRDALLQGAQAALSLARIQGELAEELRTASGGDRQRLLGREAVLLESIRNLGTFLGVATRQAGSVGRDISVALGEAHDAVQQAVDGLRQGASPRAGPLSSAGQAQAALNRVALIALEGRDQVGQSPPEGDGRDLSDELDDLAGDQEAMNQDASALSQDPGADGEPGRMEELASAQDALAGALGELADRFGGEETDDPLRDMAEEAREIASALEEGRLDAEVLQRQDELLERLLEAGRTLERDGPTEEREGTPAGDVERPPVRTLPPGLLQGSEIPLPSAEILRGLSPAERKLVLEYFDRLNRSTRGERPDPPGGGGSPP